MFVIVEKGGRDFSFYIYRTFRTKKTPKNTELFNCEIGDFECSKKVTTINIYLQQNIKIEHLERKKTPKNAEVFNCECGCEYQSNGIV